MPGPYLRGLNGEKCGVFEGWGLGWGPGDPMAPPGDTVAPPRRLLETTRRLLETPRRLQGASWRQRGASEGASEAPVGFHNGFENYLPHTY